MIADFSNNKSTEKILIITDDWLKQYGLVALLSLCVRDTYLNDMGNYVEVTRMD